MAAEYDINTIAKVLNVSPRRIQQLVGEGLPKAGKGKYPLVPCVHWYLKYWEDRALGRVDGWGHNAKESLSATKQRLLSAQADIAQMDLAEKNGKLHDVDVCRQTAFGEGRQIRDTMLSIPDRVSSILAAESDEARVNATLRQEIRAALDDHAAG